MVSKRSLIIIYSLYREWKVWSEYLINNNSNKSVTIKRKEILLSTPIALYAKRDLSSISLPGIIFIF